MEFKGVKIGIKDKNGIDICCGDTIMAARVNKYARNITYQIEADVLYHPNEARFKFYPVNEDDDDYVEGFGFKEGLFFEYEYEVIKKIN